MWNNILIVINNRPRITESVDLGLEIAEDNSSSVHFLYIMPNIMKKALFTWKSLRKLSAEERIKAEQTIEQLETVATEYDVEFVSSIKRGWPSLVRNQSHKTILRHAEKNNIDLIVMRTHKRKIPNIISKDISRRVIVNSAIPVIAHPDQS